MDCSIAISIFTHRNLAGKIHASAGIDIQAPLRTPFGEVCRIDIYLHNKCAAALALLKDALSLFEPFIPAIVQKMSVLKNAPKFFPVFFAIPGNPKNFYLVRIHFNHYPGETHER